MEIDWLWSRHSFSFADYFDPDHMGFSVLRVLNEDRIQPARGFGMHSHHDMEILTWILSGELGHKDSIGNGSVIRPGDAQRMSAGSGIRHSEMNPSPDTPVHLLQIWIEPATKGIDPGYEQRSIPTEARSGRLGLIASPNGADGSVTLHQDVRVFAATLSPGDLVSYEMDAGRQGWVQLVEGDLSVGGVALTSGDAAAISEERSLELRSESSAELLFFDLP